MKRSFVFILFLWFVSLSAQLPNGRNHPELVWQTIETRHFRILFHQGLHNLAAQAGSIAETLYTPIAQDLKVKNYSKIILVLSDVDDISNGFANPLNHTIFIWTQDPKKETTGPMTWLRRVIGHELAHMITFRACRNFLGTPWELITLGMTPVWFLEGVAQYESEMWDTHRDLLLRTSVINNRLLPPHKLDGFVGTDIIDSRLVYEEGHGLTRYIAKKYGKDKVAELLRRHKKFPLSFSWTMKRTLGKGMGSLFKEWKTDLEKTMSLNTRKIPKIQYEKRLNIPLEVVTGLRYSKSGKKGITGIERWDEGIQRLYLWEVQKGKLRRLGGPHVGSYFSWSPDEKQVVFNRKHRGPHGSIVNDLYVVSVSQGKEIRLTNGLRATDPSWSPLKNEICFVRHETHSSNIWIFNMDSLVMGKITDFEAGVEVFSPSWSSDGKDIFFSFFDKNGYRDIARIDRLGLHFHRLTSDTIDDRTPMTSLDNQWIIFCRYEKGTPNLYRMRPDGSEITCMTHGNGGYFNPAIAAPGDSVTAIHFRNRDEIQAFTMPINQKNPIRTSVSSPEWASVQPDHPHDYHHHEIKTFGSSSEKPYRSLFNLTPLLTLPFLGKDDGGYQYGLAHYAADPLNKHQLLAYLTGRKRIDWFATYINTQWEPVLKISNWGNTSDRGDHLGLDGYRLWERKTGWQIEADFPINFGHTLLSNHLLYTWTRFEKISPIHPGRFNHFKQPFQPFSGWINTLGIGYAWAWSRPDVGSDIHPVTGLSSGFSLSRSDNFWKSTLERTRLSVYLSIRQELSWERHVLAARIASVYQWGEQPVQSRLSLSSPLSIRALSESREGDRFLYGSCEYRIPVIRDIGIRIPLIYLEKITSAIWTDWGKAWGRDLGTYIDGQRYAFHQSPWLLTSGIEMRNRIYLLGKWPIVIKYGCGWDIENNGANMWYFILGNVF